MLYPAICWVERPSVRRTLTPNMPVSLVCVFDLTEYAHRQGDLKNYENETDSDDNKCRVQ